MTVCPVLYMTSSYLSLIVIFNSFLFYFQSVLVWLINNKATLTLPTCIFLILQARHREVPYPLSLSQHTVTNLPKVDTWHPVSALIGWVTPGSLASLTPVPTQQPAGPAVPLRRHQIQSELCPPWQQQGGKEVLPGVRRRPLRSVFWGMEDLSSSVQKTALDFYEWQMVR